MTRLSVRPSSAYTDGEIRRLRNKRGDSVARGAVALVDIGQRHLGEWDGGRP